MNIVSSALVKRAVIHSKGSPLSSRPSSPPSIMRPHKRGLTKAGCEAARQRTGEAQTPLASQLLWGLFFHKIQTLADFFPLLGAGKKMQTRTISQCSNKSNKCSTLLLFCIAPFWLLHFLVLTPLSRWKHWLQLAFSVFSLNYLSQVEKISDCAYSIFS